MSSDQFFAAVQVCVPPAEFAEQEHLLDIIQEQDREPFVRLLCVGTGFVACFACLEEYLLTKSLVEETMQ